VVASGECPCRAPAGDFIASGDDYHRVPQAGGVTGVGGVVVQSLIASTLLAGVPFREWPVAGQLTSVAFLTFAIAAVGLCAERGRVVGGALAALGLAYGVAACIAFRYAHVVMPIVVPLAALILATALVVAFRQWLAPVPRRLELQ
jgi:CHASE2 domain-containing sensor protein